MFSMQSPHATEQSLLDIKDRDGKFLKYFVLGENGEQLQQIKNMKLSAQNFFTAENMEFIDFFQPTLPFPVFSCRAKAVVEANTQNIDFINCEIMTQTSIVKAFAGRILNKKPVFERIDDYSIKIRDNYKNQEDDMIVRDIDNEQFYFVTARFRAVCLEAGLNIEFIKFSMLK